MRRGRAGRIGLLEDPRRIAIVAVEKGFPERARHTVGSRLQLGSLDFEPGGAQEIPDRQAHPGEIEGVRLGEATAWLEEYRQFWERRYSALDELLDQLQARPPRSRRKRH